MKTVLRPGIAVILLTHLVAMSATVPIERMPTPNPVRPGAGVGAPAQNSSQQIKMAPSLGSSSVSITTFPKGQMGMKVFSTGLEDVVLMFLAGQEGYRSSVYYTATGQAEKLIAQSIPYDRVGGRVFNLGKLPRGEVMFSIVPDGSPITPDLKYFTGPASRNPDNRIHASIAKVAPGQILRVYFYPGFWNQRPTKASTAGPAPKVDRLVQDMTVNVNPGEIAVGFEDTRDDWYTVKSLQSVLDYNSKRIPSTEGVFPTYADWDYDDVTFKFTSGVTVDEAFLRLLEIYETASGADKDAAGYAITLAEPRLAKKMGVQVNPEFLRKNVARSR